MSTYEISKSSFLSLKAEILRKREELAKAKANNDVKIQVIKKNTPLELKNKGVEARNEADRVEEDADLLKKSRSALEYKSRLYERLSSGKSTDDEKRRFLVRFDQKKRSKVGERPPSDDEDDVDRYPDSEGEGYCSDEGTEKNDGETWIDYVDCLGRTRKCLQKDLEYLKLKDGELRKTMEERRGGETPVVEESVSENIIASNEETRIEEDDKAAQEMLSSDMRREILRKKWEDEEEQLRNKTDIHYQDILFDEARTHGAGYYAFSGDEEERLKQQEALKKLRAETEHKQKRAQELKAMREKQLAARIKAAKNRKRARMGLPPQEDEPETPTEPEVPEEQRLKQEEEKRKQVEKEKLLEAARKRHVRPWDIGKEGVKEHYEMTQEEWVDKKRNERPEEFAPPSSYRKEFRSTVKKDIGDVPISTSLKFTTKRDTKANKRNDPNYKEHFRNDSELFPDASQPQPVVPTPIVNECDTSPYEDRLLADYVASRTYSCNELPEEDQEQRGKGVEIEPPPTFDYYGPTQAKITKVAHAGSHIEDSIEAGLKFLRRQVEIKEKSSKHPREMFLS